MSGICCSSHKSLIGENVLGICDLSGICGNWFTNRSFVVFPLAYRFVTVCLSRTYKRLRQVSLIFAVFFFDPPQVPEQPLRESGIGNISSYPHHEGEPLSKRQPLIKVSLSRSKSRIIRYRTSDYAVCTNLASMRGCTTDDNAK